MGTLAANFADKMTVALLARPDPFVVDGRDVAVVTTDGKMALVGSITLLPEQAKDLRVWIKTNFMQAGGDA